MEEYEPAEKKSRRASDARKMIALAADLASVAIVFVALCMLRFQREAFLYFTTDSNILAALACLLTAVFRIRALRRPGAVIPLSARVLHFAGTVAVTVTFLTVLVFLGPTYGFGGMYAGANLPLHLLVPLLCLLSTLCGDDTALPRPSLSLYGAIPVVLYGAIYAAFVLPGRMPDLYGFNAGGRWYITMPAFFIGAVVLSLGVFWLSVLFRKKG